MIRQNSSKYIKIVDSMPISQDKSLAIAKIGSKNYFIGVSQSNINLITEVSNEDLIAFELNEKKEMNARGKLWEKH